MKSSLTKVCTIGACALGSLVSGYFLWRTKLAVAQVQVSIAAAAKAEMEAAAVTEPEAKPVAIATLEEIFANIGSDKGADRGGHALGLRLELELFSEEDRPLLDSRQAGVKDAVIEVALTQSYRELSSLSGKLFFKEQLVSRLNAYFGRPVVRDIHFGSFFLQ